MVKRNERQFDSQLMTDRNDLDPRCDELRAQFVRGESLARVHAVGNKCLRSIDNLTPVIPDSAWTRIDQTNCSIDVITAIATPCHSQPMRPHFLVNSSGGRR